MRSLKLIAPAVLAALVLTACGGSGSSGTSTSASTTASSAAATTTSSSSASSSSSSASKSTSTTLLTGETESSAAVELDADTKAWFTTFCSGLASAASTMLGAAAGAANTTGNVSGDQKLAAQSAQYAAIGKAAGDIVTQLSGAPAPGFDGGDEAAKKIQLAFSTIGGAYDKAAADVAAGDPANADQVIASAEAQIKAADDGLEQALGSIDAVFPAGVMDAAEVQVPACAILAGGSSGSSTTTS